MSQTRVEEDGTVKRLVRWASRQRKGAGRKWYKRWVVVVDTSKKKS
jgi:hypothetical protein